MIAFITLLYQNVTQYISYNKNKGSQYTSASSLAQALKDAIESGATEGYHVPFSPRVTPRQLRKELKAVLYGEMKTMYIVRPKPFLVTILTRIVTKGCYIGAVRWTGKDRKGDIVDRLIPVMALGLLFSNPAQFPWDFWHGMGYGNLLIVFLTTAIFIVYRVLLNFAARILIPIKFNAEKALAATTRHPIIEENEYGWIIPMFCIQTCLSLAIPLYGGVIGGIALSCVYFAANHPSPFRRHALVITLDRITFSAAFILLGYPVAVLLHAVCNLMTYVPLPRLVRR